MVLQNYQNFTEMTSNMIYIVAFGVHTYLPGLSSLGVPGVPCAHTQILADQLTLFLPGHCVFKWILRGHLKPPPKATTFEVISIKFW